MNSPSKNEPNLVRCLVRGVLFEISEELIQKRATNSILAYEHRRKRFYDIDVDAYVFDQPAEAFEVIVYFICTGLLSRPNNVNNLELHSSLCFFEMDDAVINTYERMEHLAVTINWEHIKSSKTSWIRALIELPFTPKAKIINTFFFIMTMISYSNLCFEYTFALPRLESIQSSMNNTTMSLVINGLDLFPTEKPLCYTHEIVYLLISFSEFLFRLISVSDKHEYMCNYLTIIDLLSILSCIIHLCSMPFLQEHHTTFMHWIAIFRFVRVLKLCRYSTYVRQYIQMIFLHHEMSSLLFVVFMGLCTFFGNLIHGISLMGHSQTNTTLFDGIYYSYETILTIGFGIHIPSTPYLTCIAITAVLFGMNCLSLPVPLLALYSFSLNQYEHEKSSNMISS